MKKSLSLLVALALVFSLLTPALAFAATSQESAAGAKLKQYGVLSGGTDGDLMLDDNLKREDMIVLLSRLLNAEDEAKAHENTHGFNDVDNPFYDSYISWAKEEGLTQGIGNDRFGQNTNLKLKDLLQFQLRVLGYADVAYDDVPAKAEELGLIEEGLDAEAPVTRGQMALVTLNALNTEVNGEGILLGAKLEISDFIPDVGILAFAAVGAKKLEVKFASAVDTKNEDLKVTVKRGTVTVNTSNIKWSSDKKTATIETSSRLVEGTYTVSVEGVAEEALTASVDVQNEKVEEIVILNDIAPMARATNGDDDSKHVVVNYEVKNQYGENVSNIYVPNATASGTVEELSNGTMKISKNGGQDFIIRETVFVSLVYIGQNYTVSAQKNMEVGLSAKADTVVVTDLYNENEEAVLDTNVSASEAGNFKLLLDVKDQYGNAITDLNILKKDLIVTVGGTHIFDVQYDDAQRSVASFETVEIDGKNVVALPLQEVKSKGSATVNVVPKYSGKSGNFTVVVEEGLIYDQVILSPVSGIVAAGEDVLVPVTVLDTKGNTITDTKKLNDAIGKTNSLGVTKINISIAPVASAEFVTQDGSLYLKFYAANQGPVTVNATTENYKYSFVTIDVKAAAKPRAVVGLKSDLSKLIFDGNTVELKTDNILVEDNYGRIMSKDSLGNALNGAYSIQLVDKSNNNVTVTGATYIGSDSGKILLNGATKGNTSFTLQLTDTNATTPGNVVSGSQWNTTFRTVVLDEIASIAIDDISTLYAGREVNGTTYSAANYTKDVKVTATTKDGKKVAIQGGKFNLTTLSANVNADNATKKVNISSHNILSNANTETTIKVRAVLANGLSAEKEVKVSNAAPQVDSVKIKDVKDGVLKLALGTVDFNALGDIEVKDQYGVEANIVGTAGTFKDNSTLPTVSVTFSDLPEGVTATFNGTHTASIAGSELESGDEFTVRVQFGSVATTAKVKIN